MARDQRRLAAIVSADVAGYSRLMGQDDSSTLAALKAHRRELIDPKIAEYGGRIVKTTGDGLPLEFPSVVDAVRCAVDVQRGIAERNASVAEEQRLEFRIGINVGDIIIDGEDIYGDGVNVAARLQALAEPGQICVSKVVRDQVMDKLSFAFEELGSQQVKNIARPVEVYRVELGGAMPGVPNHRRWLRLARFRGWRWLGAGVVAVVAIGSTLFWWIQHRDVSPALPPAMSVGVMQLVAPAGDVAMGQLANTLTRDLISMLARNSTTIQAVPGPAAQATAEGGSAIRAVARLLNVKFLLDGQIWPGQDATRVTLRLMNGLTGEQAGSQAFSLKSVDTTHQPMRVAVSHLVDSMLDVEMRRVLALSPGDRVAMDYALLASGLDRTEPDTLQRAQKRQNLAEEALRRDPNLVPALVQLSFALEYEMFNDMHADLPPLVARLDEVTSRAVNLNRAHPVTWDRRAHALFYQGHLDAALEANNTAMRIDPDSALEFAERAWLMLNVGRPADALKFAEEAIAMDPGDTWFPTKMSCEAHMFLGQYEQAIAVCEKLRALTVNDRWPYVNLTAAYAQLGNTAKAAGAKKELLQMAPDVTIAGIRSWYSLLPPDSRRLAEEHLFSGLRKAGIPEQ